MEDILRKEFENLREANLPDGFYGSTKLRQIWILVPFQARKDGTDPREVQKLECIQRFAKVRHLLKRTYGKDAIDLRLRFITQEWSFTKIPETSRHPFAERPLPGKESLTTPKFNRGLLLNVGIQSIQQADVVYTHDVDLLPGNDKSMLLYGRPGESGVAFHLAGHWERYSDSPTYVGGILGMTLDSWKITNGYPNNYFGWGGEDDELSRRMRKHSLEVDRENYSPEKFFIEDLEGIDTFDEKRKQISSTETYNIVKKELNQYHAKSRDGLGANGIDTVHRECVFLDYTRFDSEEYQEWVDELSVVILPESYPILTKDAYESIEESQSKISQSYAALYKYKVLMDKGFSWVDFYQSQPANSRAFREKGLENIDIDGDDDQDDDQEKESLPIWFQEAISIASDPELEVYKGTPDEPDEIRQFRHKRLGKEYNHLWLDDLAVYSTTSSDVAKQMATILRNLPLPVVSGAGTGMEYGIIDGTACVGGNTIQFYPIFQNVIAIEFSHNRATNVLRRNLEWAFKQRRGHQITIPVQTGSFLEFSSKPPREGYRIFNGPVQVLSEYDPSYPERMSPLGEILFLDPPWGGYAYKDYTSLPIYLGTTEEDRLENVLISIIHSRNQSRKDGRIAPATNLEWIAIKLPLNFDLDTFQSMMNPYGIIYKIYNFKVMNLIIFQLKSHEEVPTLMKPISDIETPEILGMDGEIIDSRGEEPISQTTEIDIYPTATTAAAAAATTTRKDKPDRPDEDATAKPLFSKDGEPPVFPEGTRILGLEKDIEVPGLYYIEDFLNPEEQTELLENINSQEWRNTEATGIQRRVQHYGYIYKYVGRQGSLDTTKPIPEFLKPLQARLEDITHRKFDQIIVNEYKPGEGIATHSDDPKLFGDTVVSVSLGSGAIMNFNPMNDPKNMKDVYLEPGSAVFLTEDARYSWQHSIAKRKTDTLRGKKVARGTRVSITFRYKKPGTFSTEELLTMKSKRP
jgi:alkylated DNA repair dioxygenase AlkB